MSVPGVSEVFKRLQKWFRGLHGVSETNQGFLAKFQGLLGCCSRGFRSIYEGLRSIPWSSQVYKAISGAFQGI